MQPDSREPINAVCRNVERCGGRSYREGGHRRRIACQTRGYPKTWRPWASGRPRGTPFAGGYATQTFTRLANDPHTSRAGLSRPEAIQRSLELIKTRDLTTYTSEAKRNVSDGADELGELL